MGCKEKKEKRIIGIDKGKLNSETEETYRKNGRNVGVKD